MAQDVIEPRIEAVEQESPLIVCDGCGKVVPKTNLCIYCGAPILYRRSLPPNRF